MIRLVKLICSSCLSYCSDTDLRLVQAVLGAAFFATLGVCAYTFALSLNAVSSGMSASWLGLAFSGYFLARLILAPLAGYGADLMGAMPLLLTASGIGAIVPVLYLIFPSIEALGIIQICLGFCAGVLKPVGMALLGECVTSDKRGRLFGAYNTCFYSALIFGPLLGGAAISLQGEIGSCVILSPCLGMAVTFLLFLRAKSVPSISISKKYITEEGVPWNSLSFIALLLAVFGRTLGASVVITFLPRFLNEYFELSGFLVGLLFALPNIVIIACLSVTGRWADQRDRAGLTFLGMGICTACLYGFGQPIFVWGFICLAVAMGLGSALSLPASMSLATDMGQFNGGSISKKTTKGRVVGIFLGASNLGFVLGPVLAGFAAEYGSLSDAFELTALVGGLCLLPMFLVISKRLKV